MTFPKHISIRMKKGSLQSLVFLFLCDVLSDIQSDCNDDDDTLNDVGPGRIDTQEGHLDLQDLKYQNAHQDAGNLTGTAIDGNTADCTSGNGEELIAVCQVR